MGRSATCFPAGLVLLLLVKRSSAIPRLLCTPLPAAHIPAEQGSRSNWSNPLYPLNPFDRSLYSSMSIYFTGISVDQQMSVRGCLGTLSLLSLSPQLSSGRRGPAFLCPTALRDSNVRALPYAQLSGFAPCLNSAKISTFGSLQCGTFLVVSPVSVWERDGAYGRITISKELGNAPHTISEFSFLGRDHPCSSVLAPLQWVQLAMR